MARYRKIDPRIWNDDKFASLSHEGQRTFLFILTHPSMTSLGAFRGTREGLEAELGLDPKGLPKPFDELLSKGLIKYDSRNFMVFAPNFLKYNRPENPNVVKGWIGSIDLLPECPLLAEVLQRAKACADTDIKLSKAFSEALGRITETLSERYAQPLPKGMPIQEQEQEQEYIEDTDVSSRQFSENEAFELDSSQQKKASPVPFKQIVEIYNSKLGDALGVCRQLNAKRQAWLRARYKDVSLAIGSDAPADVLAGFGQFYDKIARSDFLMGRKTDFRATFDWIHQSSNYLKIYEGNYENGPR